MKIISFFIAIGFLLGCSQGLEMDEVQAELVEENSEIEEEMIWHYVDDFKEAEKLKFEGWITEVKEACDATLGKYPFPIYVYFYLSTSTTKAVSFGHTTRGAINELHLYVNPQASREELRADWIAPHEMSHLAIPATGKSNKWFSEGFATYLSRKIMLQMGEITETEFDSIYTTRIKNIKDKYADSDKSFVDMSRDLIDNNQYSAVYWGGAGFFYRADQLLAEQNEMNFCQVIQSYQVCCRDENESFKAIIKSFDKIIEGHLFQDLCNEYETVPCGEVMGFF